MLTRTNEQWLEDLRSDDLAKDDALADLRQILINGLKRGLLSQVNTNAPEFETQVEDFAQEATLKILDNLDSFAGLSRFTTWAHKIAVSVALTELRRKRWQDASLDGILETESGDYTPTLVADPAPKPEEMTIRTDMMHRLNSIINNELTDKQRTVLTASVIRDLPTAQVAKMMGMKPNAVYKLLHDARVRLKKRLESEGLSAGDIIAVFQD